MTIAESLKRFRQAYKLNQKDVAQKVGMLPQNYGRYETGQFIPSAEIIKKIAVEFSVSADYLLGLSDISNNKVTEEITQAAIQFNKVITDAIKSI